MFGSKKTTLSNATSKYAPFIHTMQDDLSGNIAIKPSPEPPVVSASESAPSNMDVAENSAPKNTPETVENKNFSQSPFFEAPPTPAINPPLEVAEKKISLPTSIPSQKPARPAPSEFIPVETLRTPSSSLSWSKITLVVISFCVIAAAAFAGYYFFMTRKSAPVVEQATPQPDSQNQVTINPVLEKFSSNKPNYLLIDMASASSENIWNTISETAAEIKTTGSPATFEFILTDANNNPVSFPIFAIAAKIELPQDVLKNLGEKFSLFLKNDGEQIRIALAISATDEKTLETTLLKQEASLQNGLSPLFLENKPPITTATYKTGAYGAIVTRYLNFDPEGNLSIDYAITNKTLYLGTSKNTLRTAIDKYTDTADTTTPQTTE